MNSLNYEKLEEILRQLKNQPLENGTLLGLPEEDREIAVLAAELQSIPLLNAPHAKIRRKYALASEPIPLWKILYFLSAILLASQFYCALCSQAELPEYSGFPARRKLLA